MRSVRKRLAVWAVVLLLAAVPMATEAQTETITFVSDTTWASSGLAGRQACAETPKA